MFVKLVSKMRKKVLFFLLFIIETCFIFSPVAYCTPKEWDNLEIFTYPDHRRHLDEALSILENMEKIYGKNVLKLCPYIEKTGDQYKALQEYGKAIECFERSLRLKSEKDVHVDMSINDTRIKLSNIYFYRGSYRKAEQMVLRVLGNQLDTLDEESIEIAKTRHVLAGLYRWQGRFDEARDLYKKAIMVLESHNEPSLPYCLKDYAFLNFFEGKFLRAEALFTKALEAMEKREQEEGKAFLDTPSFMAYLANSIAAQGRLEEAEEIYQNFQDMIRKRFGKGKFHEKIYHLVIGKFYRNCGRPIEAEEHYMYVASIFFLIGVVPDMTPFLEEIAAFYREQGHFEESEIILLKAKEAVEFQYGRDHPAYPVVMHKLGVLYREWGRITGLEKKYEISERYLKESLQRSSQFITDLHPSRNRLCHDLAVLYHYEGRFDEAEFLYRKVLDNYVKAFGPSFVKLRQLLLDLSILCRTRGNLEDSKELEKWAFNIPDIAQWVE